MDWLYTILGSAGGAIGLVFLRIFGGVVLEKVVAFISFKTLRYLSSKTNNSIDGDIVKEAEVAYYGSEKFPDEELETVSRARSAASSEHRRVEPKLDYRQLEGTEADTARREAGTTNRELPSEPRTERTESDKRTEGDRKGESK